MDLSTLTDDDLAQHRLDVLKEQERRSSLAAIPSQVTQLAQTYTAAGGDPADLTEALSTD